MAAPLARRVNIFIGYHSKDEAHLERLKAHLALVGNTARVWSRQDLRAGYETDKELTREITSAQIAILLVSIDFLASPVTLDKEFPLLFATKGLMILPVIVSYCDFEHSPLNAITPINDPETPVSSLDSPDKEKLWRKVVSIVRIRVNELTSLTTEQDKPDASPLTPDLRPGRNLEFSLTGAMRLQLHEALLSAFPTQSALSLLVSYQFNKNINAIAGGTNLSELTFNLIGWAESNNLLVELITGASERNSGNRDLKKFVVQYLNL